MEPLTGRDAVEALSLAARLGNQNFGFDQRRLAVALRSRAGRVRIMAGMALRVVAAPRFHGETTARPARRVSRSRQRAARSPAAPDRPRLPANAENASYGSVGEVASDA